MKCKLTSYILLIICGSIAANSTSISTGGNMDEYQNNYSNLLEEIKVFFMDSESKSIVIHETNQAIEFSPDIKIVYKEMLTEQDVDEDDNVQFQSTLHLQINEEDFYIPLSEQGTARPLVYRDLVFRINTLDKGSDIRVSSFIKNDAVIFFEFFQQLNDFKTFLIQDTELTTISTRELLNKISNEEFQDAVNRLKYTTAYPDESKSFIKEIVQRNISVNEYNKNIATTKLKEDARVQPMATEFYELLLMYIADSSARNDFSQYLFHLDDLSLLVDLFPSDNKLMAIVKERVEENLYWYNIETPHPSVDMDEYMKEYQKWVGLSERLRLIEENADDEQ
jgi:hypothetical protein